MPYSVVMAQVMNPTEPEHWVPKDTFGARLALIRQEKGWNIREAALACGQKPQNWSNWEAGASCRKREDVARAISDATNCDYVWLLAGGPLRSRCFSLVPPIDGQMEFSFLDPPPLSVAV